MYIFNIKCNILNVMYIFSLNLFTFMSSYENISSIRQIRETSSEVKSLIFNEDNCQYLTWIEQNSHPSLKSSLYFSIKKDGKGNFERPIEIVKTEGMIVEYKILVNR